MGDSTSTSHTTSATTFVNTKSKKKVRGVTICTKVKKIPQNGVRSLVNFNLRTKKAYGENADDFKDYMTLQARSKVSILVNSWHDIDGELKDKI